MENTSVDDSENTSNDDSRNSKLFFKQTQMSSIKLSQGFFRTMESFTRLENPLRDTLLICSE